MRMDGTVLTGNSRTKNKEKLSVLRCLHNIGLKSASLTVYFPQKCLDWGLTVRRGVKLPQTRKGI